MAQQPESLTLIIKKTCLVQDSQKGQMKDDFHEPSYFEVFYQSFTAGFFIWKSMTVPWIPAIVVLYSWSSTSLVKSEDQCSTSNSERKWLP